MKKKSNALYSIGLDSGYLANNEQTVYKVIESSFVVYKIYKVIESLGCVQNKIDYQGNIWTFKITQFRWQAFFNDIRV